MNRYFFCLALLAAPLSAQQLTARDVLNKVLATYTHVHSLYIVADREETVYPQGRMVTASATCELALEGRDRYYARLKLGPQDALAVSDGTGTWKALISSRRWTKVSALALPADSASGEERQSAGAGDLRGVLEQILLGQFIGIARQATDIALTKEDRYKLGHEKIRCYVVRAFTHGSIHELYVDAQRFVVLEYKEKGEGAGGQMEVTLKMKSLDWNGQPDEALFHFEPGRGWKEADMLVLPGERQVSLTGEHAANFTLKSLTGERITLATLRGQVVVLDFWATWCPPCRAELPDMEKLRSEFAGQVEFYGINDEDSGAVKHFLSQHHYEIPVLMDARDDVHRQYGVNAIPTVIVIGRDSVIRQQFVGNAGIVRLRSAIQAVAGGQ